MAVFVSRRASRSQRARARTEGEKGKGKGDNGEKKRKEQKNEKRKWTEKEKSKKEKHGGGGGGGGGEAPLRGNRSLREGGASKNARLHRFLAQRGVPGGEVLVLLPGYIISFNRGPFGVP